MAGVKTWHVHTACLTSRQHNALTNARMLDCIRESTRLRAMVRLWMTNKDFRAAVDKLAVQEDMKDRV